MKYFTLLILFLPLQLCAYTTMIMQKIPSEIETITVYPDRARIFRIADIHVRQGENTFVINDLPEKMIESTLCAETSSHPDFDVTSIALRNDYNKKKNIELEKLRKHFLQCEDSYFELNNKLTFLSEQIAQVRKMQPLVANVKPGLLVTDSWDKLFKFSAEQLYGMLSQWRQTELDRKEALDDMKAAEIELKKSIGYQQWLKKCVIVTIHSRADLHIRLRFNYQVSNASWVPSYDIYYEDKTGHFKVVSYANVSQTTGEDWKNVPIELSTANAADALDLPALKSWVIASEVTTNFSPAPIKNQTKPLTNRTVFSNKESKSDDRAPIDQVKDYRFNARGVETIYSDGKENRLIIASNALTGRFYYHLIPEALTCGYAICRWENTLKSPLLAGKATLWYEAQMIGKIDLPHISAGEVFDLPIGIDRGVKVTRSVDYYTYDKFYFSRKKCTDVTLEFMIENFTGNAVDIELDEALPKTTQPDAIEIKNLKYTHNLKYADNLPAGVVRFNFNLNKTREKVIVTYTLEYDKDHIVTFGIGDTTVPNVGFGPELEPLDPMK